MHDELVFSDEPAEPTPALTGIPWHILVVDDEPAVHEVTTLVMTDFHMDGRPLRFSHCYSAAQARSVLAGANDIALILLDVVMETEHAGLDLVRHIRDELGNLNVRIILRTGQPGQAPEEQVIRDYDINDYKEKTDLTRRKLITAFYSGLRAYRDLMRIEHARAGLRRSIEAIRHIYDSENLRSFASAVLEQVNYLLNLNAEGLCASRTSAYAANAAHGTIKVLAATAAYSRLLVDEEVSNLPVHVQEAMQRVLSSKSSHYGERHYAGYFRTKAGSESMIYMEFPEAISAQARELLEIFSSNVAITYDGLLQREENDKAQRDTIILLGQAIENRGGVSSLHPQRVGAIAALLALRTGWAEEEIAMLRLAATLHDVGKIHIDEALLRKPGPLNAGEWENVKTHADQGGSLLSSSQSRLMQMAASIAHEHHERWDGSGYPQGLRGETISPPARIVGLADVLDSLVTASCYKPAWPMHAARDYITVQAAKQFDPALVDTLNRHWTEIEALYCGQLPPT